MPSNPRLKLDNGKARWKGTSNSWRKVHKICKWVLWFDWSILAFDLANLEANVELKEAFDDGMKIVEAKTLPIENEVKVLRILMDQSKNHGISLIVLCNWSQLFFFLHSRWWIQSPEKWKDWGQSKNWTVRNRKHKT